MRGHAWYRFHSIDDAEVLGALVSCIKTPVGVAFIQKSIAVPGATECINNWGQKPLHDMNGDL